VRLIGKYYRENGMDLFEDEDELLIADQEGQLHFQFHHKSASNHGGTKKFAYGKAEILEKDNSLELELWAEAQYHYHEGDYPKKYTKCDFFQYNSPRIIESLKIKLGQDQTIKLITKQNPSSYLDLRGDFKPLEAEAEMNAFIFNYNLQLAIDRWEEIRKANA
jgi:hypothetical protein